MKKFNESFKDFADKNPWLIGLVGFVLICLACHLFVEHTALGQAIHNFKPYLKQVKASKGKRASL